MSVIRVAKNSNYTVINNTALNDNRLSWKAKGIIAYMLSKPDDWVFHMKELVTHATDGERAFRSGFEELKHFGYITRQPVREGQRIKAWETIVHEIPQDKDNSLLCGFVHVENEDVQNVHVQSEDVQNSRLLSTDINQVLNKPNTDINQVLKETEREELLSSFRLIYDTEFLKIKNYFSEQIKLTPTDHDLNKLHEAMQFYEPLLIIEAVNETRRKNKTSFAYVLGILDNWRKEDGIQTYNDWQIKKGDSKTRKLNQKGTEKIPDWFYNRGSQQTEENTDDIDFELERKKILQKLGR